MKNEVYSWRVSSDLKSELEREARMRKTSVAAIVDSAVRNWLQNNTVYPAEDAEQRRLHRAAGECFGMLAGHNPRSRGDCTRGHPAASRTAQCPVTR